MDMLRQSVPATDDGRRVRREFIEQVRTLMFDMATILDRVAGSTTMLLHMQGTTRPGTPVLPEFLHATVYLPPSFLRRHPDTHLPIAQIVQAFIETVGVPTVNAWAADAKARNWTLTQSGPRRYANDVPADVLIPAPRDVSTAQYTFYGCPLGSLRYDPVASPPHITPPTAPSASPTPTRYGSEDPEEYTADALALMSAVEHIAELEDEINPLRDQNGHMTQQVQELNDFVSVLQGQLARAPVPSTRAPSSPRPYAPSPFSTPTRTRSILDARSPGPSTSPVKASALSIKVSDNRDLPLTAAFLATDNMHAPSILRLIRLMIRNVPTTKWYKELAQMELTEMGLVDGDDTILLDYLTRDLSV
ncbi:hypothetical protein C8R43DRAFT_1122031 [Mycena crocata]|nr:hypothetical protein C8R43DRAFT_1122031 [Mycena crocata]